MTRRASAPPGPADPEAGRGRDGAAVPADGSADAADAAEDRSDVPRLGTWKRIARYLHRDVRTVQRWEASEQLPVHRLQHHRQGSVFAYADELDIWLREHEAGDSKAGDNTARDDESAGSTSRHAAARRLVVAGCTLVLLLAGAAAVYRIGAAPEDGVFAEDRPMLAVLPFDSLGDPSAHGYFAAGLTEDLITELGRVNPEQLGVIARTTVMRYQDSDASVARIGRELGVDYILEGTVRRQGQRLRVTAQLIEVQDQTHIWADSYDRRVRDVLGLQAALARQVASTIQVQLRPGEAEAGAVATVDPKAYDLMLRGRDQLYRWMSGGFIKGREYLRQAVEVDPDLANAWAWLAMANMAIAFYELEPDKEAWQRSVRAARRALALDPRQGLALVALGWKAYKHDWDWDRAQRLFQRAVAVSPNSPWPHWAYAQFLSAMGRDDEAIAEARRGLRLDPASLYTQFAMHYTLRAARRYDAALASCQSAHARLPERPGAFYRCALETYQRSGQYHKAIKALVALHQLGAAAGYYYGLDLGDHGTDALRRAYREHGAAGYWTWVMSLHDDKSVAGYSALSRAIPRVQLGRFDEAMSVLEEGFRQHDPSMTDIKAEPLLQPLHGKPRFRDLLGRMRLLDR